VSTRVALVTGGARGIGAGIGAGIAERLRHDGWIVVVADLLGPTVCDVSNEVSVATLIGGLDRIDALVCNAGISFRNPLKDTTLHEWNAILATNPTSTFLLVRAAEAKLRAAKGAIVTIASTRAHMSEPGSEAYAASKGGLLALTHALAVSLAPDVRVNCISPGWIHTKGPTPTAQEHAFHPAGRVGTADDIGALTSFPIGPDRGFVTGAEFVADGGVTRKMIYPE
jgi:NAD(P)-dependent dehydrogenase (short-subunit alcohol dehydrogenase family)